MITMIDFSDAELSSRNLEYGGRAGEKKGIVYNHDFWFLKFPKSASLMNNVRGLSYVTSPLARKSKENASMSGETNSSRLSTGMITPISKKGWNNSTRR